MHFGHARTQCAAANTTAASCPPTAPHRTFEHHTPTPHHTTFYRTTRVPMCACGRSAADTSSICPVSPDFERGSHTSRPFPVSNEMLLSFCCLLQPPHPTPRIPRGLGGTILVNPFRLSPNSSPRSAGALFGCRCTKN